MQRHLHLHALVLLQDDALHHDQPVVCGHSHPHQQQPAGSKHCGQDGQRTAAARTHLEGVAKGVRREEELLVKSGGKFGKESWREVVRNEETLRQTYDSHTCKQLLAVFLSQLVIAQDELVTHRVATNPVKGYRGVNTTDDDFIINLL